MRVAILDENNTIDNVAEAESALVFLCKGEAVDIVASGRFTKEYLTSLAQNSKRMIEKLIKENYKK